MRLLFAIKSCFADQQRGCHEIIRQTWGKDVKDADLKFFIGETHLSEFIIDCGKKGFQADEFVLPCKDDYNSLPFKTQEILKWSLRMDYDFTYLADNDTFLIPDQLKACGFQDYDYAGKINRPLGETFSYKSNDRIGRHFDFEHAFGWASGGLGYFISRKAAEFIVKEDPIDWFAEDLLTGQIMGKLYKEGKIKILDLPDKECVLFWHWPKRATGKDYDPKSGWMEKMQQEHGVTK